ncbi:hypothetical protein D3C84_1155860 [compost metagenome]
MLDLAGVLGGFHRAVHAGVALEVMDHPGAEGKGEDHIEEIAPVLVGKTQWRGQPGFLQQAK